MIFRFLFFLFRSALFPKYQSKQTELNTNMRVVYWLYYLLTDSPYFKIQRKIGKYLLKECFKLKQ